MEPHALEEGAEADLHGKDADRAGERPPLGVDRHPEAGHPIAPRRGHFPHRDDRRLLLGKLRKRLADRFARRGRATWRIDADDNSLDLVIAADLLDRLDGGAGDDRARRLLLAVDDCPGEVHDGDRGLRHLRRLVGAAPRHHLPHQLEERHLLLRLRRRLHPARLAANPAVERRLHRAERGELVDEAGSEGLGREEEPLLLELAHLLGGQAAAAGDHRHLGIVHAREHVEVVLTEMLAHRRVHVGLDGAFEIARPDDRGLEAEEIHRIAVEIRLHRLRRHVDAAEIGHRHVIAAGRHREVGRFGTLDPRPHLLPRLPECSEAAEELVELGEVHRQIGVGEIDDNGMDLGVLGGFFEELTELVEVPPLPWAATDDQARRIELIGADNVFVGPTERDQLHLKLCRLGFFGAPGHVNFTHEASVEVGCGLTRLAALAADNLWGVSNVELCVAWVDAFR